MNKINWQERLNQLLSTGKNKSYFTVGVTVLFVVVMLIIGVVPAVSSLGSQAEDNRKRDEVIAKLDKKLSDLKDLTIAQEEDSSLVAYFDNVMPNGESQESLINLINTLAASKQVTINSFVFDKNNQTLNDFVTGFYGERIKVENLTITLNADKENTLAFLKELESSARIIDINELSLIRSIVYDSNGSFSNIKYSLSLKILSYYFV